MFYSSIIRNSAAEMTAMSAEQEAHNAENATDFLKFDIERLLCH